MSSISSLTGSTSSISSSSSFNGRIWGLASGLDVDTIVTGLVSNQQTKVDNETQAKEKLQWKQEAYQNIQSALQAFESTYLSSTGSSSMLSSNTYAIYSALSDNTAVTATALAGASQGSHTLVINQSALAGEITGSNLNSTIAGSNAITDASTLSGKTFKLTVDGTQKTVTIGTLTGSSTSDDIKNAVQSGINSAFGYTGSSDEKAVVSVSDNKVSISVGSNFTSTVSASSGDSNDALSVLGISSGSSTALNLDQTVNSFLGTSSTDSFDVSINGKTISIDPSGTLYTAIKTINNAGCGAKFTYSGTFNNLSLSSSSTGASSTLSVTDSSNNFLHALFGVSGSTDLDTASVGTETPNSFHVTSGRDAEFTYDGVSLSRSSNSFTVDNITYNINQTVTNSDPVSDRTAHISMTSDTSSAVKSIQNFVSAYNSLLDTIYTQTKTQPDEDYPQLTTSQKSSMTQTQIDQWNEKAKQGVLFDDDTLNNIASQLRSMVTNSVTTSSGETISLEDLGIHEDTTLNLTSPGKLVFDSDSTQEMTEELEKDPDAVTDLFTKTSSVSYSIKSTNGNQQTRKNQEGIINRLEDVVQDATYDGVYPYEGSLAMTLGNSYDTTSNVTSIYSQLSKASTLITQYKKDLASAKNKIYSKFETLETYMEEMNSQSSIISSLSSGS